MPGNRRAGGAFTNGSPGLSVSSSSTSAPPDCLTAVASFRPWSRVGASPQVAYELNRAFYETELTDVLPAVRVPTLVLHRGRIAEAAALEVAETIPAAEAVRLRGEDYFPIFLSPEIADEIEAF